MSHSLYIPVVQTTCYRKLPVFKSKHSIAQCTFAVHETIQCYLNGNSNVYTCTPDHVYLDASKAFEWVEYVKLFQLMCRQKGCVSIDSEILDGPIYKSTGKARMEWFEVMYV